MSLEFKVGSNTDKGKRESNQDAFCFDEELGVFVVADGMKTEVASRIAADYVKDKLEDLIKRKSTMPHFNFEDELRRVCLEAHKKVIEEGEKRKVLKKDFGTTLEVAAIDDDTLYVAHIGDSRTGILRQDKTYDVITEEKRENFIEALKDERAQDEDLMRRVFSSKSQLLSFAGQEKDLKVEIHKVPIKDVKKFVLYSDGLNVLSNETIGNVLAKEGSPQKTVDELINLATTEPDSFLVEKYSKYGKNKSMPIEKAKEKLAGEDNTTIIVVEPVYKEDTKEEPEPTVDVPDRDSLRHPAPTSYTDMLKEKKPKPKRLEKILFDTQSGKFEKEEEAFLEGMEDYDKGLYFSAFFSFERPIRNPENKIAIRYAANSMAKAGVFSEAIELYERVLSLDKDDMHALNALGCIYLSKGDNSKAIGLLKEAAEKGSGLAVHNLQHYEDYCIDKLNEKDKEALEKTRADYEEKYDVEFIKLVERTESYLEEYPYIKYEVSTEAHANAISDFQKKLHDYVLKNPEENAKAIVDALDEEIKRVRDYDKSKIEEFVQTKETIRQRMGSLSAEARNHIIKKSGHYRNIVRVINNDS